MKIRPLRDRVLVEREEAIQKTASGIFIPESAQEKRHVGKIVSVGAGKVSDNGQVIAMTVKVGDKVLFEKYGGNEIPKEDLITVDGKEYIILREDDILGVVEG